MRASKTGDGASLAVNGADIDVSGYDELKAMGRKVSDEYTVPLCSMHHRLLHQIE